MLTVQTLVVAFSLSADAFAASLAKGARFPSLAFNRSLLIACGFGVLEALAPLLGYLLGRQFAAIIADVDHWIAFVLLGFLGVPMIVKSFSPPDEDGNAAPSWSAVLVVALGTSVDATVVGITLALVSDNIPLTILTIGVVTFAMTFIGLRIGGIVGRRAGQWAEFAGGLGLAAIGVNILVTHLVAI